jgi:branched-chain amino acid aminotransferase, group II
MDVKIVRTTSPKAKPDMATVPFGTYFSDHMFMMDYTTDKGWYDPRIIPYGPLEIEPCATIIQYATEVFEGLKAYRTPEGKVQMFRPDENAKRIKNSAERMALPQMDVDMMVDFMRQYVEFEADWVPADPGTSLYLRPFIYATDPCLSLHPIHEAHFCIIACPVGNYFPDGLKPVPILIEKDDVRAVRGGTGYAKCGGNYAGAMRAGEKAEKNGFSQVLWIDGVERKYVEEAGGMNVMFKINGDVVTPQLNGSVLPGITRKSSLEIVKDWGMNAVERLITVEELIEAAQSGALEEAWMVGTAAVVCPIGELAYDDQRYVINGGTIGEITQKLYDDLTAIQWGRVPDRYGWNLVVK